MLSNFLGGVGNTKTFWKHYNFLQSSKLTEFIDERFLPEFYCGKNVYIFLSDLYSDIYNMGRGPTPFCKGRAFHFLGFVHFMDDTRYFLEEDPNVVFSMDNFVHGLECNIGVCVFR